MPKNKNKGLEKELWHDLLTGLSLEDEEADVAINIIRPYIKKTRKEAVREVKEKFIKLYNNRDEIENPAGWLLEFLNYLQSKE
jgi:hypothetical protein